MKLGFLHIPRTGGTYLESILQQLGPEEFINFFGIPQNQIQNKIGLIERIEQDSKIQELLKSNLNWQTCKLFSGHFSHNVKNFIQGDVKFFTILRDPIQRTTSFIKKVISSKAFVKLLLNDGGEIGNDIFWKNFETYIQSETKVGLMSHERNGFSNYMTKAIAGCDLSQDNICVNSDLLEQAKQNLDNMIYVGIFENYKETVQNILRLFNLNVEFNSKNLEISIVPNSTKELLEEINYYDIQLYNYFINKQ